MPSGQVEGLKPAQVVEVYSAGIKLALVAHGEADMYVNRYQAFHDWDICAGHILVDGSGRNGDGPARRGAALRHGWGLAAASGLLASNGKLHAQAVEKMKSVSRK